MRAHRSLLLLAALPVCAVFAVGIVFSFLKVKPSLSPAEESLSGLAPAEVRVFPVRQPLTVTSLDSPLPMPGAVPSASPSAASGNSFPSTPLAQLAPQQSVQERIDVSMVLVNGDRRIAVINGIVVKEGDMIHAGKVERIGRDGVMIKGRNESRWIKLE
ncbi:MAG: hypothetical protein IT388_05675 [Nitrospirales bacterium]|nr:hypothetical protein [Nitrospirales bacterium]